MTAISMLSSAGGPCARRLRNKLVISYLYQQRLVPAFQSMVQQTDALMCGDHLQWLLCQGQWADALAYLARFNTRNTVASNALHVFIHTVWALDDAAAAAAAREDGSVKPTAHQRGMLLSAVICRCARLCSIVKGMLSSPQQCASLDWNSVRIRAGTLAYFLAREDPGLYRLMQLLGDDGQMQMLPHHLLPIISRRRRRHVKRRPGRRAPGPAIARLYLTKRASLHSSSPPTPAFIDESLDRVASLVDECIKAGKNQKGYPSIPGWLPRYLTVADSGFNQREVPLGTAPAAPASETNSVTTSVPNAGSPASSHSMSGAFINQHKNYGISLTQNSAC